MSKDKIPAYQVPITLCQPICKKMQSIWDMKDTVRIAYQDGTLVLLFFPRLVGSWIRRIFDRTIGHHCDEGAMI